METQGRAAIARAAGVLMTSIVISRILGYLRDIIIAAAYGQTRITDAYMAAFSIPDFLYNLLVAGAATAAFIPVFSGYISTDREEEGWVVASTIYNIAAGTMFCGIIIAGCFAPSIVSALVPGFEPENIARTVVMTRIMLVQAFFMALNGIGAGILNSYQRFLGPAVASVMYNAMIIFFGVSFGGKLGITAFSVGVTAGAATQFIIQVISLRRVGFRYTPALRWRHPGVRRVLVLMIPILLSYTLTEVGLFVQQNISSTLPGGAVSALRWAQRLMQMPVSIFAVTMVIALYPTLNNQIARGEVSAFKKSFSFGLRSIFYITIPCSVGMAVLSRPIVRLLYQQGNFTAGDTALTAYTLIFYCLGLFAQGGVLMMNRVFYALQDTWTSVVIGAGSMIFNILLNLLLIGPMGIGGLSLAYSIAGVINLLVLLYMTRRKIGPIGGRDIAVSFGKTLAISGIMGAAAYATAGLFEVYLVDIQTKTGQVLQAGSALVVCCAVFFGLSAWLKMEEMDTVWRMITRRKHE